MALPRIDTPTYQLTLPSTQEPIDYRPFLVKEQKIIMMAQESSDEKQMIRAMTDLITSCTFEKIDISTLPTFDVEYMFLKIRGKSAGETVNLTLTCPDDNKTKVQAKVNLDDINCQMTMEHTNEIKLGDNVRMKLRYPLLKDMKGVLGSQNDIERVFFVLNKCVTEIHWGDKIYNRIDITDKEMNDFIDSMSNTQLQNVMDFFESMPKLRHAIKITNPNTKVKSEVVVEGLTSFLG